MPTILSPEEPWVDLLFQGEVAQGATTELRDTSSEGTLTEELVWEWWGAVCGVCSVCGVSSVHCAWCARSGV